MKRLLPLAIVLLALIVLAQSCAKSTKVIVPKTVTIRGLFSLTGNWSSLGVTSQAAMELAAQDVNSMLDDREQRFRIAVEVKDTKLDVETAKAAFRQASADGITFIVGPQSSAELAGIKPLSDAANILLVSQSSTAGSLAIANDNIFRFCPSDKIEGAATAATIYKAGKRGLVTLARDDAGNKGLQTSTGDAFTAKGGEVAALTPYATTGANYTAVIASLKTEVTRLSAKYTSANVGVYLASFDEGIDIMKLAAADPVLSSLKWYGGDGVVLSTAFLGDATVAEFAIKTGFFAPSFGLPAAYESKWKPVVARIKAKTGVEPDAFALAAYDAVYTIALALRDNGGNIDNFTELKRMFVARANTHNGVTGADALDAAGDRASGTFDYFGIVKDGAGYKWTLVGKSD